MWRNWHAQEAFSTNKLEIYKDIFFIFIITKAGMVYVYFLEKCYDNTTHRCVIVCVCVCGQ